jgi:L-lactate dehydrogenase complex protein LldG
MNVSPDKEIILKKIRKALTQSTPIPFPGSEGPGYVFHPATQEKEIEFAEQFTQLTGKFMYCLNEKEAAENLQALVQMNKWTSIYCPDGKLKAMFPGLPYSSLDQEALKNCHAAITGCECLIARTGSMMLSSALPGGRTTSVYAPVHICIAYTSQLVWDIREGIEFLASKYNGAIPSSISLATGPSRTADIEKTLVVGIHGPGETYVFLIEDRN